MTIAIREAMRLLILRELEQLGDRWPDVRTRLDGGAPRHPRRHRRRRGRPRRPADGGAHPLLAPPAGALAPSRQ